MESTVEQVGDVTVVTLHSAQLDAGNADDLRQEMTAVLADCRKLVLDLGRVEFVDSRGCGAILSCLKQIAAHQGDLKLCNVHPYVRTVFDLIRLHRICEIVATRDDAIRSFQGK